MHFYDTQGNSCHELVGKNGKTRATTIKDARELGLFPSVSTIKELGIGQGLIMWMHDLLLQSVLKFPYHPEGQSEYEWRKQVMTDYAVAKGAAAKRGTEIHDKLDIYYTTGIIDKEDEQFIVPVIKFVEERWPGVKWISEKSFVHPSGYAGRVDMHSLEGIVLDFKTKDKDDLSKITTYDDHKLQLSAYQEGLNLPAYTERYNLFVSTSPNTPGACKLIQSKEHDKWVRIFNTMFELWKLRNNYDPAAFLNGVYT